MSRELLNLANPDGLLHVERNLRRGRHRFVRHNAHGVDLNRNFDTHWGRKSLAARLVALPPESVRQSVREVLAIMAPGGGYVAGASHDYILEETPVENVVAMFDTAKGLDSF